jgi:hypothetical protein
MTRHTCAEFDAGFFFIAVAGDIIIIARPRSLAIAGHKVLGALSGWILPEPRI